MTPLYINPVPLPVFFFLFLFAFVFLRHRKFLIGSPVTADQPLPFSICSYSLSLSRSKPNRNENPIASPFVQNLKTQFCEGIMVPLKKAMFLLLPLLAFCSDLGEADNLTFVVKNSRSDEIIPRVINLSVSPRRMDHPVVKPNDTTNIFIERESHSVLFFATGCSQTNHQIKCISGDCPIDDCVKEHPVATMIEYKNGTLTISTLTGFNVGIKGIFQGSGCNCTTISCVFSLADCLEPQRIWQKPKEKGQPQMLVACNVSGLPFLPVQDCVTPSSYYGHPPSRGTHCQFKNGIWQVIVS